MARVAFGFLSSILIGVSITADSAAAPAPVHHSLLERLAQVEQRLEGRDGSDRGQLFLERASIERRLGRDAAALNSRRCAAIWRCDPFVLAKERCRAWLAAGDAVRAAAVLDEHVAASPNDFEGRLLRGRARLRAAAFAGAALDLERARVIAPGRFSLDAEMWLAEAWGAVGDVDRSLSVLDRAIEARGELPALVDAAIEAEIAHGRFDEALARHDRRRPTTGSIHRWAARRGDLLRRVGRTEDAIEAWTSALAAVERLPRGRRHTAATERLVRETRNKLGL